MHPTYTTLPPRPQPPYPLHLRLLYALLSTTFHYFTRIYLHLSSLLHPLPPTSLPTLLKTYPANPHLTHRIFYPPTYRPGHSHLPLFISIHGGGFCLNAPSFDDSVNASLAARQNCIVVALDYSKSPFVRYPHALRECVATVMSILNDISLSFDRSRVAIGGYSAGGNLALAVCQAKSLKGKLKACVAFYPVVDFTTDIVWKCNTRPYEKEGEVDMLRRGGPVIQWAYLEEGQDTRDPCVSPIFAAREALPEWVCVVGVEYDCLAYEAGVMIARWAGMAGTEDEGDGGICRWWRGGEGREGFERREGRDKWIFVRGLKHGFSHHLPKQETKMKDEERKAKAERMFGEVGDWLGRGAFAGAR